VGKQISREIQEEIEKGTPIAPHGRAGEPEASTRRIPDIQLYDHNQKNKWTTYRASLSRITP
jgi:hypothetical protein